MVEIYGHCVQKHLVILLIPDQGHFVAFNYVRNYFELRRDAVLYVLHFH